ncbi:MAG: hypothetical protein CM15mP89_0500 [Gammaproteobacteria bacterium]|nr:MAG: hypothetical protein CM15mP89_0500 [Gammaproteobacteria bacterium]
MRVFWLRCPRRRRVFDQFLTPDYRAVLLGLLEPEQGVLVVNELPDELRNAALADREPEALAEIVEQLDDDDVADILHELPDEVTGQVLASWMSSTASAFRRY